MYRAQQMRLMGYGTDWPDITITGPAGPSEPITGELSLVDYDLSQPGRVYEVKQAIRMLAERGANKVFNPKDPIQETTWQRMALGQPYQDSWDWATADEFLALLSRYALELDIDLNKAVQHVPGAPFAMVGGLQPTALGVELIAGALHRSNIDPATVMPEYMAWRGASWWAPPSPSAVGTRKASVVQRTADLGDPIEWQPLSPSASVEEIARINWWDNRLNQLWKSLSTAMTEQQRSSELAMIENYRIGRNTEVNLANARLDYDPASKAACDRLGGTYLADEKVCEIELPDEPEVEEPELPLTAPTTAPAKAAAAPSSAVGWAALIAGGVLLVGGLYMKSQEGKR
jgi:hypothetical protein